MTKTAGADGRQRVTAVSSPTSSVRTTSLAGCSAEREPLTESVLYTAAAVVGAFQPASSSTMPIHDPATLEKFRQAATAYRNSRSGPRPKPRSISDAGNGGVGRGESVAMLVPLSPSSFNHPATSPSTAETRFFSQHSDVERDQAAVADDDEDAVDECAERSRRAKGSRRRTLAAVTASSSSHHGLTLISPWPPSRRRAGCSSSCRQNPAAAAVMRRGPRVASV